MKFHVDKIARVVISVPDSTPAPKLPFVVMSSDEHNKWAAEVNVTSVPVFSKSHPLLAELAKELGTTAEQLVMILK